MGGNSSKTACEANGSQLCSKVAHATMCVSMGGDFQCACTSGYVPTGKNAAATCVDIDECETGLHTCDKKIKNSVCRNTDGSYECVCDMYRELSGNSCEDINECLQNRGGCGNNSECVNQIGAPALCKCWSGYTGNNDQPGTDCKDIDECELMPCSANATCINTPGSYRCQCNTGFTEAGDNQCEAIDYCGTGQSRCDPYFADCVQSSGAYTCKCKEFFTGTGTVNNCIPISGYEDLACQLLGVTCTSYQQCEKDNLGSYSCKEKSTLKQLSTFFSEGASSDTPIWVWLTVATGAFVLFLLLFILTSEQVARHFRKKSRDEPETTVYANYGQGGYGYGGVDYYG
ncbi:calcium binding egf domain-containing protein [Besnoitia besnoiti]|uniref:Calcium binding egf domain-containing protein n=1 Tax=Besnoitia besnoiti TaxID=94643 RepID=A0A2A9MBK1_BESBE|nr:calcium binding egf domain-containing protein [Besnoitia besnoiti]PFH33691.1 calcium binding egf domain-containing protein [Besnoitia besnoiti]